MDCHFKDTAKGSSAAAVFKCLFLSIDLRYASTPEIVLKYCMFFEMYILSARNAF
jgi:hypothetical protein